MVVMKKTRWPLVVFTVLLMLVVGCIQTENPVENREPVLENEEIVERELTENNPGPQEPVETNASLERLGTLCVGASECIAFCLTNRGRCETYCQTNFNSLCERIFPPESNLSLGELCGGIRECEDYCSLNGFACEAYCVSHSQNAFCKQRFSYLFTASGLGNSLMRFPEFRNHPYTFADGKLVEPKPKIEHLGIELDFYNPTTNKAGDFAFNDFTYPWNSEVYNPRVFYDYGALDDQNQNKPRSSQIIYILPLGTKVRAMASGIVTDIADVYSGDYTIFVTNPNSPTWHYEHEHVINPVVVEGETVVAGQVLAEVSDYSQWLKQDGFGVLDIGLFRPVQNAPRHHCPFLYLDESIKQDSFEKIRALYQSWEEYKNDSTLYDETAYSTPGCVVEYPID